MSTEPEDFVHKAFYIVSGAATLKFAADWCAASKGSLHLFLHFVISAYEHDRTSILLLRGRGCPVLINAPLSRRPMLEGLKNGSIRPIKGMEQRINTSIDKMRDVLLSGLMSSFVKERDGRFTPVPQSFWNTSEATDVLWDDVVVRVPTSRSDAAEGRIVVRKTEVVAFCSDGHEGLNALHVQLDKWTGSPSKTGMSLPPGIKYMPPYLGFMLQCVTELALAPDERRPKDEIEDWLKSNWPKDLPPPSRQKIAYMATLLRDPSHERGGLLKMSNLMNKRRTR